MVDAVLDGKKAVSSPSVRPTRQDVGLALISQTQVKKSTYWFEEILQRTGHLVTDCSRTLERILHVMTVLEHHTEIELRLTALLSYCNLKREIHRLTTPWRRHLINHQWLLWGCVHLLICMKVWPIAAASAVGSSVCMCMCSRRKVQYCDPLLHCKTLVFMHFNLLHIIQGK